MIREELPGQLDLFRRPRLLDLFCCSGGAGMGYARAGFEVVGVDIEPQPLYPFEFHQGDALRFAAEHGHEFDVIHASPPCQSHSKVSHYSNKVRKRPLVDLLPQTRLVLEALGRPYVIENVNTASAALRTPLVLCGTMFGLLVYRHRGFESWGLPALVAPAHPRHLAKATRNGYLPTAERPMMTITGRNGHHSKAWVRAAAAAMGIEWVTTLNQVCEAIPPAYTQCIGEQIILR